MKRKYFVLLGIFILIIVGVGAWYLFPSKQMEGSMDAKRFKEEYEALNHTVRESDGATYQSIQIDANNPIQYVDTLSAIDVLKQKKAILYIGAEWCPWCRNAVPILLEVAKEYKTDTIYYLNLDSEKSSFEIQNQQLVKTVSGSDGYYQLLEVLKDHLNDYQITEDGISYNTGEKRIYIPYVLAIKDGRIVDEKTGTISLKEGQTKYDLLDRKQISQVYDMYDAMFQKVYS